jgi:ferredoxin
MHLLESIFVATAVSVIILGGPLTLYALIKLANAYFARVNVRFVRTKESEAPLGIFVSWDPESIPAEVCRVKLEFHELVRGGRATTFSYTFEDKSAKKRSFLIPMKLKADDYAMLSDDGLKSHAKSVQRSFVMVEIEDTKGNAVRRKLYKPAIRAALSESPLVADKDVDLVPASEPDKWSVMTRVFPWRKVVAAEEAPAAAGGHKPKVAKKSEPSLVDFLVTKVWIEPGCIVCDACENEAPQVFKVLKDTCIVVENADLSDGGSVKAAAEGCPVDVIKFTTVPKPKVA